MWADNSFGMIAPVSLLNPSLPFTSAIGYHEDLGTLLLSIDTPVLFPEDCVFVRELSLLSLRLANGHRELVSVAI